LVWRDTENIWPGQDWREAIRSAIEDGALVFFSLASQPQVPPANLVSAGGVVACSRADAPSTVRSNMDDPDQDSMNCEIPEYDLGAGRKLSHFAPH
jgi:hypothetical protein